MTPNSSPRPSGERMLVAHRAWLTVFPGGDRPAFSRPRGGVERRVERVPRRVEAARAKGLDTLAGGSAHRRAAARGELEEALQAGGNPRRGELELKAVDAIEQHFVGAGYARGEQ